MSLPLSPQGTTMENHELLWDVVKTILTIFIVPFCVWIVKSQFETKKEINTVREEHLKFKTEVVANFASKSEIDRVADRVDTKMNEMQTAVTQRIDTMQANIATMIATIAKK